MTTGDILLADRCLKKGAGPLSATTAKPFTAASIGGAIATRAIMADLRVGVDGIPWRPGAVWEGGSVTVSAGAG